MEFNEKVYMLRKRHNLTLEEVGKAVGVGKSTVKKWESGEIANMRRDKIAALASALHTSPGYLMGWEEDPDTVPSASLPENIVPMPKMNKVPLVGTIACGTPILAIENIEEEVDIPEHLHADMALRCKGDSMIGADIQDGDIVYIKITPEVNDGDIAAVVVEDEATLKRVYYDPGKSITLASENAKYRPFIYSGEELNHIRIIGRAVGLSRCLVHTK